MPELSFQTIAANLPSSFGTIYLAYSGGIDSHVLLHLCAGQAQLRPHLVAVYVNHGLQALADDWERHCRQQTELLGVRYLSLKVDANAKPGESPEAAARQARYRALQPLLQTGDLLLLAQHREDQLETFLLQLFRGAGVQGLAGMPEAAPLGQGIMLRPLLNVAKADIQHYAERHGLKWCDDPTNLKSDYDRNFLRNEIVPLLKTRWPALDKTVARSARHCGEAAGLLDAWGQKTLSALLNETDLSLALDGLQSFAPAERHWLLRQWFDRLNLKPPSEAQLQTLLQQMLVSGGDPKIYSQNRCFRKYRQRLYCLPEPEAQKPDACDWQPETKDLPLANGYRVGITPASSGIAQNLWQTGKISLRPRCGGERLKLPNRTGRHCLKKLYQEAGIPPWDRDSRPLVYLNGRLAAVAGLWIDEWAWSQAPEACYSIIWQRPKSV